MGWFSKLPCHQYLPKYRANGGECERTRDLQAAAMRHCGPRPWHHTVYTSSAQVSHAAQYYNSLNPSIYRSMSRPESVVIHYHRFCIRFLIQQLSDKLLRCWSRLFAIKPLLAQWKSHWHLYIIITVLEVIKYSFFMISWFWEFEFF